MAARNDTAVEDLPIEVLAKVFAHVPPSSLGNCLGACKAFKSVILGITHADRSKTIVICAHTKLQLRPC